MFRGSGVQLTATRKKSLDPRGVDFKVGNFSLSSMRSKRAIPPPRLSLMPVNTQYNIAAPSSLAVRIAGYQRHKMFRAFLAIGISSSDTILDVGVTSDRSYDHSNYLEAWYAHKSKITTVGIDEGAAFLREAYPGVRYVKGDGRSLPFADDSFDYVHSSAVLEHVGNAFQQRAFIAEARRVARKGVFLTTPNRWYPIEFHTLLPVVHWLPRRVFRRILIMIGKEFFASEQNLNLLSVRQLRWMAEHIGFCDVYRVHGVRLAGLVSNMLFILEKKPETRKAVRESALLSPEVSF